MARNTFFGLSQGQFRARIASPGNDALLTPLAQLLFCEQGYPLRVLQAGQTSGGQVNFTESFPAPPLVLAGFRQQVSGGAYADYVDCLPPSRYYGPPINSYDAVSNYNLDVYTDKLIFTSNRTITYTILRGA